VQAIVADGLYHPAINESIALRMSVTEPPAKYPTADLRAEVRHGRQACVSLPRHVIRQSARARIGRREWCMGAGIAMWWRACYQ